MNDQAVVQGESMARRGPGRVWRAVRGSLACGLLGLLPWACGASVAQLSPVVAGRSLVEADLPPAEELAELLRGDARLGVATSMRRVAVAPLKAVGLAAERAWVGSAVSAVVGERLSQFVGASVVERRELAKLADVAAGADVANPTPEVAAQLAAAGKLVGADVVLVGTITGEGDSDLRARFVVVQVEQGVVAAAHEHIVGAKELDRGASDLAAALAWSAGVNDIPPKYEPILSADKLEAAGRALHLHHTGKPDEALGLYEKALSSPSKAWGLELDYVHLLTELGLTDEARTRMAQLVERVPVDKASMCTRARVLAADARGKTKPGDAWLPGAREAIQLAASCNDRSLQGAAVASYARDAERDSYPLARAAYDKAAELTAGSAWWRCWVDWYSYEHLASAGANRQGSRAEKRAAIGGRCANAGNHDIARTAYSAASSDGAGLAAADGWRGYARTAAAPLAGLAVVEERIDRASELRALGKYSASDQTLLELLGTTVRELAQTEGALPGTLAQLDSDVLARAKLDGDVGPLGAAPGSPLQAQARRLRVAKVISAWAGDTSSYSVEQARVYEAIASDLAPNPETGEKSKEPRWQRRLERAGLPWSSLQSATELPRRGAANFVEAFDALEEAYYLVSSRTETKKLVTLLEKVAERLDAPKHRARTKYHQAVSSRIDEQEAAKKAATAGLALVPDEPSLEADLLGQLAFAESGAGNDDEAAKLRARQTEAAKRDGPLAWVMAAHSASLWASFQSGGNADTIKPLLKASDELAEQKLHGYAAHALELAAGLLERDATAAELRKKRSAQLDLLDDPLRSLEGRIDRLREGGRADVESLVKDIDKRLQALQKEGRVRDVARLTVQLPTSGRFYYFDADGNDVGDVFELYQRGRKWVQPLARSVEYLTLAAQMHMAMGEMTPLREPGRQHFQEAAELYGRANRPAEAVEAVAKGIEQVSDEYQAWEAYDTCEKATQKAADGRRYLATCAKSLGELLVRRKGFSLTDSGRLSRATEAGLNGEPILAERNSLDWMASYRVAIAGLAVRAGRTKDFDYLVGGVERDLQFRQAELRQQLDTLIRLAQTVDGRSPAKDAASKSALKVVLRRDNVGGGDSAYLRAYSYAQYAEIAHAAGDKAKEEEFLKSGRKYAQAERQDALYRYDQYEATVAKADKKWRDAAAAFDRVRTVSLKNNAASPLLHLDALVSKAMALHLAGQRADALAAVRTELGLATAAWKAGTGRESPCLDTALFEVAASLELAGGSCAVGSELRSLASKARRSCYQTSMTCKPSTGTNWCEGPQFNLKYQGKNECRDKSDLTEDNAPWL